MDPQQILWDWAVPPCASNLSFKNCTKTDLMIIHSIMQKEVMKRKLPELEWFSMSLTIKHMIEYKLPAHVLSTFGVTIEKLVQEKAYVAGQGWQSMFEWTDEDWKMLGYTRESYLRAINKKNLPKDQYAVALQWGPKN